MDEEGNFHQNEAGNVLNKTQLGELCNLLLDVLNKNLQVELDMTHLAAKRKLLYWESVVEPSVLKREKYMQHLNHSLV